MEITSVSPERMRGNATVVLVGTGFDPATFNNDVEVDGSFATVTVASAVSLTFTLPFSLTSGATRDTHLRCSCFNFPSGEKAYFWLRIKADVEEVADDSLPLAVPGPLEPPAEVRPRYAEAKDMEALSAAMEALLSDSEDGQVLACVGASIDEVGGDPAGGGVLLADAAEPTGLRWSKADMGLSLPFGGACPAAANNLAAGGDNAAAVGGTDTEHAASAAGTVDLLSLLVKSGGATLDRVRLIVNGSSAYDSGAGLGLGNNAHFTAAPGASVAAGDLVEVECTSAGGTTNLAGMARLTPA